MRPGPVRVIASTDGDGVATLVVEDTGAGFTDSGKPFDPFAETGRGLGLVRAVADAVKIEPIVRGGTRVTGDLHGRRSSPSPQELRRAADAA